MARPKTKKSPRPMPRSFDLQAVGRGHAQNLSNHNREPVVFVIALSKCFSFRRDWHRDDRASPLVRQHQNAIDEVLKADPKLQRCDTCCRHCGIRFVTHPRNAGRKDLRCPFGCRQHHQREAARARSRKYNQTAGGQKRKKVFNIRRSLASQAPRRQEPSPSSSVLPTPVRPTPVPTTPERCTSESATPQSLTPEPQVPTSLAASLEASLPVAILLEGVTLDAESVERSPALPYLRMLVRVLEKVPIRQEQLVQWLLESLRQRSIAGRNRKAYVLGFLNAHPP